MGRVYIELKVGDRVVWNSPQPFQSGRAVSSASQLSSALGESWFRVRVKGFRVYL